MLQPQPAGQADDRNKHKFMVQWANVPTNYSEDVESFVRFSLNRIIQVLLISYFLVETRIK